MVGLTVDPEPAKPEVVAADQVGAAGSLEPDTGSNEPGAAEPSASSSSRRSKSIKAKAKAQASQGPRVKTVQEETIKIWDYGELRYNSNTQTFRAFCSCANHVQPCSKQRKLLSGPRPGQGRPVGYLVAWLRDQNKHPDKDSHVWSSVVATNFDVRAKARRDFSALPGAQWWLNKERAQTADEPHEEPLVVGD